MTELVRRAVPLAVLFGLLFAADPARAQQPAPLTTLDADKLVALAPLLGESDLALIEFDARGRMRQTTTVSLVAAPPEVVREVVIHPESYPQFVRNLTRSQVHPEPGGTFLHEYVINYRVYTVDSRHRYRLLPKGPGDAAAPVEMYDPDPRGKRHYRWEFLAAGGATVLVVYGYADIPRDGFSARYLDQAPTLEAGFALIPQMTLLMSMKARAEHVYGKKVDLPKGKPGSYDFLLDRGAVAILRTSGGRLAELDLIERSTATPTRLLSVAADPARWSKFVPTLRRSTPLGPREGLSRVETEQSLPLMSWTTIWGFRAAGSSVDMIAMSGDIRGGRLRWDARPSGPGRSELVLRARGDFQNGSLLLRQVYKLEPYLEYGFDVALELLLLQSVRYHAETTPQPQ